MFFRCCVHGLSPAAAWEGQFCRKAASELPEHLWVSHGNYQGFGRSLLNLNYLYKTSVLIELVKNFSCLPENFLHCLPEVLYISGTQESLMFVISVFKHLLTAPHGLRHLKSCCIFGEKSLLPLCETHTLNCPYLWELCLSEELELETLVLNPTY